MSRYFLTSGVFALLLASYLAYSVYSSVGLDAVLEMLMLGFKALMAVMAFFAALLLGHYAWENRNAKPLTQKLVLNATHLEWHDGDISMTVEYKNIASIAEPKKGEARQNLLHLRNGQVSRLPAAIQNQDFLIQLRDKIARAL